MNWFFFFKRAVGMLAQPLPVVFLLLAAGMALVVFTERRRSVFACMALSFVLLAVCTLPMPVRWQARPLERLHFPYAGDADFQAVVVLGSGVLHSGDTVLPALSRLGDNARARVAEGVRLWRLRPEAVFVTCGYGFGTETGADVMAEAAMELGVSPERIHRLGAALDTRHEAELSAGVDGIAGGGKALVVTAAAHMPRAMEYFRAAGVNAAAAPCDFIAPVDEAVRDVADRWDFRPNGTRLADSESVWHEWLGLLYQWISGGG